METYKQADGTLAPINLLEWAKLTQDEANVAIITTAIANHAAVTAQNPSASDPVYAHWWWMYTQDPNLVK